MPLGNYSVLVLSQRVRSAAASSCKLLVPLSIYAVGVDGRQQLCCSSRSPDAIEPEVVKGLAIKQQLRA
jgi:hypothetical protein